VWLFFFFFLLASFDMALSNLTALNEIMRAVVWQRQPFNISVLDVPKPSIINQTDVIVRMARAGICGSDLHIYRGTMEGQVLPVGIGHEGVGYVSEVGSMVDTLSIGDLDMSLTHFSLRCFRQWTGTGWNARGSII
jgi:threonine dehydrogenase-like Zn-dependent dehydrogenase